MIDNTKYLLDSDEVIIIGIDHEDPENTKVVSSLENDEETAAVLTVVLTKLQKELVPEDVNLEDMLSELGADVGPKELEALDQFMKQAEKLKKDLGLM